ncbi:MAG: FAD binding domain-containing protein [Acidimicrobiia bacterium]
MHEVQIPGTVLRRHVIPAGIDETLELLASLGNRARLVAGATDLIPELHRRQRGGVDTLIDISRLAGLDAIEWTDDHRVRIGALVTHNQVVASDLAWSELTPLAQACREVGSPQLRNRATVVGNVVTASPANDTITPLRALGATLIIRSVRGARTVDLADFHMGVRRSVLADDEMVVAIDVEPLPETARAVFVKSGLRAAQAISVVHMTVVLTFDGVEVSSARILLGSVAPTIVPAAAAEALLVGSTLDDETIAAAATAVATSVDPIDDVRAPATHRTHLLGVMTRRALTGLRDGDLALRDRPVLLSATGTAHLVGPGSDHRPGDPITATINGSDVTAAGAVGTTLLDWLRDHAGPAAGIPLTGTKEGCAEGECGACTVMMDGAAVMSCLVPAVRADGCEITTVEGLATDGALHPLQQAFIDRAAVQCGFCIPGFLVAGGALLAEVGNPDPGDITEGLSGNLCRCTGYYKIIDAVRQAAELGS